MEQTNKCKSLPKRVLSIVMALAFVVSGLQVSGNPAVVKNARAASTSSTMETETYLDERYVKDTEVLRFYKILANAERMGDLSEVDGVPASQVLQNCTSSDYTKDVYGTYLTEYSGKINFSGLTVKNVDGIGWARSAKEIDLSGAVFTNALTEIPANEFAACKALEKIVLPGTVKKIGGNAFESCLKLSTLVIGSGTDGIVDLTNVDEIGASAFSSCSSMEEVKFAPYGTHDSELKIGANAFSSCAKIRQIEIPIKTADNLGANAFENCENLEKVGLQNDLSYVSNALFKGASTASGEGLLLYIIEKGEDSVSRLPEQVTYIGDQCFSGANMKTLDLTRCTKLVKINQYAFSGSQWILQDLILPSSLKEIEMMAFNACKLDSLTIPENCSIIGEGAFSRSGLSSIQLPKTLKEIRKETFSECQYLRGEDITIPTGSVLETIGSRAFKECKQLGTTAFLKDLTDLQTIEDEAFSNCYEVYKLNVTNEQSNLYGDKRIISGLEEIILPDCVQTLGASVFADNYALRRADLGTGVIHLPDKAFFNSRTTASKSGAGLETVIVSGNLQSIGEEAFANQSRLHTIGYRDGSTKTVEDGVVQFKEGLLSVGAKAFLGCGIQSSFSTSAADAYVIKGAVKDTYSAGCSKFLIYDYENVGKEDDYCRIGYINESDIVNTADLIKDGDYVAIGGLTESGSEKYDLVHLVAKEVYVTGRISIVPLEGAQAFSFFSTYDTESESYQNRLFCNSNTMNVVYFAAEALSTAVSKEPAVGAQAVWTSVTANHAVPNVAVPNVLSKSFMASYVFGVENVIIPDTVIDDKLGERAFEGCINLNEVTLSKNLTEIKNGTFAGAGMEVLNSLNTSTEAKYDDYYGLRTVKSSEAGSVTIPNSVKTIGTNAFSNCYNLLLQTKGGSSFGTGVESIGDNAFMNCLSLDSIRFPTTLKTIGREAFAGCSVQEQKQRESFYTNTGQRYVYWCNRREYGTKGEKKKGLNEIDFTAATKLEGIGAGAFKRANVVTVNLTDSPLVKIPDNLFEQCTFLKTIAFQEKTESVGSNVLKDSINIASVRVPANAVLKRDMISGAFGKLVSDSDPTLVFSYNEKETIVLPIGSSVRLPIKAVNKDNINGEVKISAGDKETIIGKENAYKGMYAEIRTSDDPYSFVLYGTEYITDPVTVRVVVATSHQYAGSTSYMISPHEFAFQVKVQDQPTEKITVSAAADQYVKNNPSMYVENSSSKILYLPFGKDASTKGVTLTTELEPLGTTSEVEWTSDNPAITISDMKYEKGSGVATAVIQSTEIGDGIVTVKSGEKTDKIHVYSVIPVAASNGLTCTTGGTYLGTNLTPNSGSNPYGLSIGDEDQLVIKANYGNTDYTDEQIASYGEKWVFQTSDETVMSVKEDGTIKALKEGDAVITVSAQGSGQRLQFYFHVADQLNYTPASILINGENVMENDNKQLQLTMNIGENANLSAKVVPSNARQDVTWEVTGGDKSCVSVDENGVVSALKRGTGTIITVSSKEAPAVKASITIIVNAPATGLKILNGDFTLDIGKSMTISKTTREGDARGFFVSPVDSTDGITWTSSNEGVLSVTSSNAQGVTVKAVAAGTAILTGTTSSGVSASVQVTVPVTKIPVNGILVDKQVTINVGSSYQLRPQIQPANANESVTYTYQSSNAKIATVDANGLIRAVAPGTVNVTVKTNTNRMVSCQVIVKAPAKKVVLAAKNRSSAKKVYVAKGQSIYLKVMMTPKDSTDTVTYKSSKSKIAAVNPSGVVTAKKKGTAKITATASSKKKATITVIVQKKAVASKKVTVKAPKTLKRGKTARMTVSLRSAKSTDTLTYASSNTAIAQVDECGYVTALKKKGTVKITVTASSGKKVTKKIKVK